MKVCKKLAPNFDTLVRAAQTEGHLCIMECQERATGAVRAVVCAVNHTADEYELVPIAVMIDGNPYELYSPPLPSGGFAPFEPGEVRG